MSSRTPWPGWIEALIEATPTARQTEPPPLAALSDHLAILWLWLARHADDEGICWPSLSTLARETGKSRRAIIDALAEGEKRDLWSRNRAAGGSRDTTRYTIHRLEKPTALGKRTALGKLSVSTSEVERMRLVRSTAPRTKPSNKPKNKASAHAALSEPEPSPAFTFPLRDRGEWTLPSDRLHDYRQTYPAIAIETELFKARLWLIDNPDRRKTAQGMSRFLSGWLSRAKPADTSDTNGCRRTTTADLDAVCPLVEPTEEDFDALYRDAP